jgi:UDPglucose--hexose-1-phosphate uridylyltransferase
MPDQPHLTDRTAIRLADGRDLIYFDDEPGKDRTAPDTRDLPPVATASEVRHDDIHDEWITIAAHRQGRTHLPPPDECPLCPSQPGRPTEIPSADYDVVVFENRFPSFVDTGRCEVIAFTSDHAGRFADLPAARLATLGRALLDRTAVLSAVDGVEYVYLFENRGEEIGVTIGHPHGQVYGYPFIPPRVASALDGARRRRDATGNCVWCDALARELAGRDRVVAETDGFVAFVPSAPRWPFEVHVLPRRHVPDLAALAAGELAELLRLQADVMSRIGGLFPVPPPTIQATLQAPVHNGRDLWHLHTEAFTTRRSATKLKYLAASESGAGAFINDVVPERAAAILRERGRAD